MDTEELTSLKNPKVLLWRSLKDKKARVQHQSFLVEGVRMVRDALASGLVPHAVLLRDGFVPGFSLPEDVPIYVLPEHVFQSVCDTKTPQGIAAVLPLCVAPASGPRLLALDGLQDPGNVGTIIRTADAAGFDGVLMSGDCADLFSPKVLRATMGSLFHLGFSFPPSLPDALNDLKSRGYSVLSSQLNGTPFFERENVAPSFVLIVGNEGNGVSLPVREVATHRLCLPMRGEAESLNAAVAAGIMMYDLTRNQ